MSFIHSRFASDEDWQDLLHDLVNDVPKRVAAIDAAVASADVVGLTFLVHQLKGACGSYGFDEVSELALNLECVLHRQTLLSDCQCELADFRGALLRMTDQPDPASALSAN